MVPEAISSQEEKKVEYLELVYDLIFVYLIGRNNSLLQYIEGGFITPATFVGYILCTLAVIQIWSYTTFYINLYGRNGIRDHVFLIINMYLLYHMADGIGTAWHKSVGQFCCAWILTLLNIALQYIIEIRNHRDDPWRTKQLKSTARIILGEAALACVYLAVYRGTGVMIAYVPILFGIVMSYLQGRRSEKSEEETAVDFRHLSERAMLFVVFTFGEMIISITEYFRDEINANTLYFSGMAFLIIVGLFLSYEVFYNRIVDRDADTSGTGYILLHVFLIFALNNISVGLKFMHQEAVALLPKTLFITGSFILYFLFLFLACGYSKEHLILRRGFSWITALLSVCFFVLMYALRSQMTLNIAVSVLYVFAVFAILFRYSV